MAATGIVYDGVGDGGTLFDGKKFWIAQRVPSRSRWVEAVEANGGSVVLLEKMADILIADHARKDVPAGSYSWTYIEKSVQNGRLESLEDHLAGRPAGSSRPVGASQPAKGSRTPFTAEDDRILFAWVTNAEKKGVSTMGNIMYQDLERANPRHTFQSWRDRWIKYVRPRSSLNGEVPKQDGAAPINGSQRTETSTSGQVIERPVSSDQLPYTSPAPQRRDDMTLASSGTEKFTTKDFNRLMKASDDILNIDEGKWNDAWQTWAKTYPGHTAEEWIEFWETDVRPMYESGLAPRIESSAAASKIPSIQPVLGEEVEDYVVKDLDSFTRSLEVFAKERSEKINVDLNISGRHVPLFRLWQVVKVELGGFDEVESTRRWELTATKLNFNTFRYQNASAELRNAYVQNLLDFEDFQPVWLSIQALNAGEELTDSQLLELQLKMPTGFESFHDEGVEEEGFGEEEEAEIEEEFGGGDVDKLREEDDDEDYDENDLDIPSSPPQLVRLSSRKRHRQQEELELLPRPSTPGFSKRQRIDKGKAREVEIPSTPEEVFNANFPLRKPLAPSPLTDYIIASDEEDETASRMEREHEFAKPFRRNIFGSKNLAPTAKIPDEPETQDFHFAAPNRRQEFQSPGFGGRRSGSTLTQVADSIAEAHSHLADESSTQSQTDSQRAEAELQTFINSLEEQGYDLEVIVVAMQATTMHTGDVTAVMDSILDGHGIPDNIEGVWTEEDDQVIWTADDIEEYDRVAEKHGEARCSRRRQFLREKQEALIALGLV